MEKTISQYAKFLIKKISPNIKIIYDKKKPNGTPRKILDTTVAKKYGWKPKVNLEKGFKAVYQSYLKKK